jgi:ribosomal protein S18 acetylase RimI-like enzyme
MISIRKSSLKDIDTLVDFQLRLADETESVTLNPHIVKQGLEELFKEPSRGLYYVAESDGAVVGCHLITYEWSEWRNGNVWWLQSVYVRKDFRGKGVFKSMYDNLLRMIEQDPKILGLRLYVDKTNVTAQKVYSSLGMNGEHYTVYERMKG